MGLCKDCYAAFLNNSGGYKAGKNPPCFDKPARRRKRRRTDEVSCCLLQCSGCSSPSLCKIALPLLQTTIVLQTCVFAWFSAASNEPDVSLLHVFAHPCAVCEGHTCTCLLCTLTPHLLLTMLTAQMMGQPRLHPLFD